MSRPAGPRALSRAEKLALLARRLDVKATSGDQRPLSSAQTRLWFLDHLLPGTPLYNIPARLRLTGELHAGALELALGTLIQRHEVLRTTYSAEGGQPRARVTPPEPFHARRVDLRALAHGAQAATLEQLAREEALRPFDLRQAPLLRAVLVRLADDEHVLLLTLHHIAVDGQSLLVLVRELEALYPAFVHGLASPLPAPARQYAQAAALQERRLQGTALAELLAFWRRELQGAPVELPLPYDRPRRRAQARHFHGGRVHATVEPEVAARLRARGDEQGATLFMVLLAAWQALLQRYTGQRDMLVGTPVLGRTLVETEHVPGLFANTLVLRGRPAPRQSFRELLTHTRAAVLRALSHQELPFEKLVEELRPSRTAGRNPLFDVMFALQSEVFPTVVMDGLRLEFLEPDPGTAKFDLSLTLRETRGRLTSVLEYSSELFLEDTARRLLRHYHALLDDVATRPDARLCDLTLDAAASLTATRARRADDDAGDVVAALAARAAEAPEAPAVVDGERVVSAGALHAWAGRVARRLRQLGAGPETRVALLDERAPETLAGLLGVLEAGAACVPLDPSWPEQHLRDRLADAQAVLLLCQPCARAPCASLGPPLVELDAAWLDATVPEAAAVRTPECAARPDHLACVTFVSSSAGTSRGVLVTRRALSTQASAAARAFGGGPADRVFRIAALTSDAAVAEMLATWLRGAALVLRPDRLPAPGAELHALLERAGVTRAHLPAAYWHEWVAALALPASPTSFPPALRQVVVSGEALSGEHLERWRAHVPETVALLNAYGPAECALTAVGAATADVDAEDADWPLPADPPFDHVRAHALDEELRPVPPGALGELHLGGPGLARGYHGTPALTAERFVPDPFSPDPGARLYRSGDRVRFDVDGRLHFRGRIDAQARGWRVEPGNVDAGVPAPSDVREVDPAPSRPETTGGASAACAPLSSLEEALAALWTALLGRAPTQPEDDFFALGGHSLLAMRLAVRVHEAFGVALPPDVIFEHPTLRGLAQAIVVARGAGVAGSDTPIEPAERNGPLPLSSAQARLWFLEQLAPDEPVYAMPFLLRLRGRLEVAALRRALDELVRRHEVLRTRFAPVDGQPMQWIEAPCAWPLDTAALDGLDEEAFALEVDRRARAEVLRPFDLGRVPCARALLLRRNEHDHALLLLLHHISADGWGVALMLSDLSSLYAAFAAGRESPLPEPALHYGDCVVWQARRLAQGALDTELQYWRGQLEGAPASLPLPCAQGCSDPGSGSVAGGHHVFRLSTAVAERVRALGRAQGATPFMVLLAAFEALLHRTSGQADFTLGTPVAGRARPELERVVGLFTNTVVLRARLTPALRFRELVNAVRRTALEAFAHQELPFERVVEAVRPQRTAAENPLFRVMFALQNLPRPPQQLGDLDLELREVETSTSKFDLSLTLVEEPGAGLLGAFEYRAAVVSADDARNLAAAYATLLEAALAQPDTRLADLPLLDGETRARVLAGAQGEVRSWPASSVHALVEAQARAAPDRCAIAGTTSSPSYAELDLRAARLATRLRALGVGPEVRVAVCAERSPATLAALLAVLKAGGAFAALDPLQPARRLERACAQVHARVLLADRVGRERLRPARLPILALDADDTWTDSPLRTSAQPHPETLAYVVCTSGTTGEPRAVGVSHHALLDHALEARRRFELTPDDRVLQFASLAFDVALEELFPTWLAGAALVLRPDDPPAPDDAFTRFLDDAGVSVVNLPASYWQEWTAALAAPGARPLPPRLRLAVVGSEPVTREAARLWAQVTRVPLLNAYGTSETAITSTTQVAAHALHAAPLPIGRPWANVRARVLDEHLQPVPTGVTGELFLGGPRLARGYLGRPDLTADRFRPDPFGAPGARLYRSGDRARHLNDGALQFLGRVDHQVKLRGLRLEPDEVAAALVEHPRVRAALVVPHGADAALQLVAYHVPAQDAPAPDDLRAFLRERLPAAFIPHAFVALPAFPLTPAGKIDRDALPLPDPALDAHAFVAPHTPEELRLAELWADLLHLPQVGAEDDFFALGGHSLLAMRLLARVEEEFGVKVPLDVIFERPTLRGLAQAIVGARGEGGAGSDTPIEPAERNGPLPLSSAQARLWFLEQLAPDEPVYAMPFLLRLRGRLEVAALRRALDELVRRHEVLRTRFAPVDGQPMQWIEVPCAWPLDTAALDGLDEEAFALEVDRRARAEVLRPFDLGRVPCARALLLRRNEHDHALLLLLHHISADGWGVALMLSDLSSLYAAFAAGRESPLPEPALHYGDCVVWQARRLAQGALDTELEYWRGQLEGAPASLPLPCAQGCSDPGSGSVAGGHHVFRLSTAVAERVRALGRAQGATPFMVLLAAFEALLHRTSGQADFTLGTPVAGRARPELERVVGLFTNTVVLRARLTPALRFRELVNAVRRTALEAFAHQELPFERVVEAVRPQRTAAENPLFRVMFALQNLPRPPRQLGDLDLELREVETSTSKFDLSLTLVEEPGAGLLGAFEYRAAVVSADDARNLAAAYATLLEAALAQPDTRLADLPLLDGEARARVLAGAQGEVRSWPASSVHALVEAQARAAPDRCAIAGTTSSPSYAELDLRAARLATRLRALGVGPEVRVAVCAERSPATLAALLAVLKAGGAFAALDPLQPARRLERACAQMDARVLLADRVGRERLRPARLPILALDADDTWTDSPLRTSAQPHPEALAYVVCTSGTTGEPRAVGVSHHALLDHALEARRRFELTPDDRVLQFASLAFDVALEELFPAWLAGATLVLRPDDPPAPDDAFTRFLDDAGVSVINLPASYWQEWTAALAAPGARPLPPRLRLAVVGSEPVTREAARLWAQVTRVPLLNAYGTSETAITSTTQVAAHALHAAPLPIGRPWANVRARVLDEHLQPVPTGVTGELFLGGPRLARGYLGRPDLTADRFRPDPFGAPGARLYRSGDRARHLNDGALQFLGRVDHQVKLRGLRLEPDEVAAALVEHPRVRAALVVPHGTDAALQLVAYHVPAQDAPAPDDLRAFLRERLPAAFIPHAFVALHAFPLTPAGKIDRDALPLPDPALDAHAFVAPHTPEELRLAELWADLLHLPQVGAEDDFFALGGHSLLAMRLVARVEEVFGVHVALRALFEQPTLRAQARLLTGLRSSGASAATLPTVVADPAGRFEPFPLTELQEAYWVGRTTAFELGNVGAHGYQELDCETLDLARFEAAWRRLIERHDMLRAVVRPDGRQQILERVPAFAPSTEDLRGLPPAEAEQRLLQVRAAMSHQVLPADEWPLFRVHVSLLRDRTRLHLSSDALIADDLSWQTLERELLELYHQPARELPPLELTFRDYVLAEERFRQGEAHRRALEYWQARGTRMPPPPELPLARPLSSVTRPTFRRLRRRLAPDAHAALERQAARHGCTLSALLLAAFGEALAVYSRAPRFCLALTRFHRLPLHPQVERILGDFTRVALLELDLSEPLPFGERARHVQARLWDDLEHGSAGGVALLRELSRRHGVPPVVPVVFTSTLGQDDLEGGGALAQLGRPVYAISQTPQVMLDHQVFAYEGALVCNWDAVAEVFPEGLLEGLAEGYFGLLERLSSESSAWDTPVTGLVPARQLAVRAQVNATARPIPETTLHRLFLDQAEARRDAPAVIAPQRTLTYGELEARSAACARQLVQRGVQAGERVAVVMDKGWEQSVAALGILRAGGAYVPLDPALPRPRLDGILQQAEARFALTQPRWRTALAWPAGTQPLAVDEAPPAAGTSPPVARDVAPDALAYVIYTSGSTGTPKGVMISHRGAVNTIVDLNARLGVGTDDRVLSLSSFGFDLSVYDLFGLLAAGGAMVLPEAGAEQDPAHWVARLIEGRVTLWNSVPALLELLVEHGEGRGELAQAPLRALLLSGDRIALTLPERARRLFPKASVLSLGGATEASIWSIAFPCDERDPAWPAWPYGRPLANQSFHVLDERLEPRPDWVPGELFIGGTGLALGYLGDEPQTRARFLVHPRTGERLYRTGDAGYAWPDGTLQILGRLDHQVKVRGFRIELGEIEAALQQHPAVREAAATVHDEPGGERRLLAGVVPQGAAPPAAELREFLRQRLPAYMLPSFVAVLERLPLGANGKVDRRALATLAPRPDGTRAPAGRADEDARRVAALAARVLGLETVAPEANLLELGATSVDLIRLLNLMESDLGFRPRIAALYAEPTPAALAKLWRQTQPAAPVATSTRPASTGTIVVIKDEAEREAFRRARHDLRHVDEDAGRPRLALPEVSRPGLERRTQREFSTRPVPLDALAGLLACLRQWDADGGKRYRYGSAGGLYPVQAYLHAKPGRVAGLGAGVYYYHSLEHRLVTLAPGAELNGEIHEHFWNRPIFERAAFSLFCVARMGAIEPLYGEDSLHFATLETGAMCQLLEESAVALGLGLCQIGAIDFERVRALFRLRPDDRLIHTLVGGLRPDTAGFEEGEL